MMSTIELMLAILSDESGNNLSEIDFSFHLKIDLYRYIVYTVIQGLTFDM